MNPSENPGGHPGSDDPGTGKSFSLRELFGQLAQSGRHAAVLIDPRGESMRIDPIPAEEIETYIYGLRSESTDTNVSQEDAREREDEPEGPVEGSNEGGTDERS